MNKPDLTEVIRGQRAEAARAPRCRACDGRLVIDAGHCPHCGEPNHMADAVYRYRAMVRRRRAMRQEAAEKHAKPKGA